MKNKIEYKLIKTNRKTIAISVDAEGSVTIRAPRRMTTKQVDEFVSQNINWILKKQSEVALKKSNVPKREYVTGGKFLYMGKEYTLDIINIGNISGKVYIDGDKIVIITNNESEDNVKCLLKSWYIDMARAMITSKVMYYEKIIGKTHNRIFIREQKTRWGSCSVKGNLNFNWKLIMAPEPVMDYVIVHELCHLVQMNHSKEFWNEVGKIIPDYYVRRKWLKTNGYMLNM